MKLITYSFLLFLFIYNIPIIGILGTGYLSSIIVFFIILADKKKYTLLATLLKQKIIYILLSIYLAIIIFGFISTIFNHSYDFTINRTLINNILSLFCCLFFTILFFEKPTIEKHFSIILILQSFIIIAMILSSDIREFIQSYVRTEDEIEYMSGYGGVRGLGVSGSMAFGLAATMGLLGYIFIFHINNANNSSIYNIFIFFICFFASLSAGRTSFLGFFLGLLILTLYSISLKTTFKVLKYLIITILTSILLYIILINIPSISEIIEKYSAYAFQPIINYL